MNPLISIIVPAYNIEAYLARTLDSIIAQTYNNIEIVVVNDGSKDGTGAILDEYAQRDARILAIHKENGGVSAARRDGILSSHGEYIGFVDGDDVIDPDMYQRLLANLLDHDADISHCGYQVHEMDAVDAAYFGNDVKITAQNRHEGVEQIIRGTYEPTLCTKLFKASMLKKLIEDEMMDLFVKMHEDLLMNFYLFGMAKQTVFEGFCPYHYIKREGSATTCKPVLWKYRDPVRVNEIMLEKTIGTDIEPITREALVSQRVHMYRKLMRIDGAEFKEYAASIRNAICASKQDLKLLSKKQRFSALLILYTPKLFRLINSVYSRLR